MAFVIAHITDTHLSGDKPFFRDNFLCVADALKKRPADLVVNTGDVSLNGADRIDDLTEAKAHHDALGSPWLAIPGNHDVGDNQEIAKKQPTNVERRERWLSVFGDDYWMRDVPGWRLLGINSLLLGSDIPGASHQEAFIKEVSAGLSDRQLALFLHKPLFHNSIEEDELTGHAVNLAPRQKLLAALGTRLPKVVCCGHLHEHRESDHAGMRQVWAPAVSFTLSDWFLPTHGGVHTCGFIRLTLEPDGSFATELEQPDGLVHHDLADFPDAYGDLRRLKATAAE